MSYNNESLNEIKAYIRNCLNQLYTNDKYLFERNKGKGICERGLVFRFAHYLQNKIEDYYVDCDFNSSFEWNLDENGNEIIQERTGKVIQNRDDSSTKRFVDIILHKRDPETNNDYICFEFKKWNNNKADQREKDFNNLRKLTSEYGYEFGFHIVLGKTKNQTKCSVFRAGNIIENNINIFVHTNKNNHA